MNIRQGDILFKRIDEKASGKKNTNLVIADGEATGHQHVLLAETGVVGDNKHFTLTGKAKLIHPEHDTIKFDSGSYMVITEREFDYLEETMKEVQD